MPPRTCSSTPQARPPLRRSLLLVLCQRLCACLAALAWGLAPALAQAPEAAADEPPGLADVRRLAGADPASARTRMRALRAEAQERKRPDWRLRIDDLECRLLTDVDLLEAQRVAAEGLMAASRHPVAGTEVLLQRLRACHAGAAIDLGDEKAGLAELEEVLQATTAPGMASARAMALLERGVRRSRHGELVLGQEDLLWACETFARLGPPEDEELCLSHLANQNKRVGDLDEALRILSRLLDSARKRSAVFDESIYLYGIAQVHATAERWEDARRGFTDSLAIETRRGDEAGMVYSEYGLADALLHLGQPQQALDHVRRAKALLRPGIDPLQAARLAMAQAEALTLLGRAGEAEQAMRPHEAAVRAKADDPLLLPWLKVHAQTLAAQNRWREAYEAMTELRRVERHVQGQQLSRESARLRQQFNRERDASAIRLLEQANAQGLRLRNLQALALVLFVLLLAGTGVYATRKFREARRLRMQALNDELTSLPNRRAILAHAEGLMREVRRGAKAAASGGSGTGLSVLMIDADHFKAVNDRHGHAVGDEVLREMAGRLAAGLRGKDRLGRIGGEEFVALLPDAGIEHALSVAERMRRLVASVALPTAAGPVALTVSIGAAALDAGQPRESLAELMERADEALYRAKAQGRNLVIASGRVAPVPSDDAD